MKKTIIKYAWAMLLPLAASCNDEWDEHYGQGNPMAHGESLWEAMKGRPELSNFVRLVENVGYEYYFSGDRMFTLFAPTNDYLTDAAVDSLTEVYNTQKNNRIKNNDNTVINPVWGFGADDDVEREIQLSGRRGGERCEVPDLQRTLS